MRLVKEGRGGLRWVFGWLKQVRNVLPIGRSRIHPGRLAGICKFYSFHQVQANRGFPGKLVVNRITLLLQEREHESVF